MNLIKKALHGIRNLIDKLAHPKLLLSFYIPMSFYSVAIASAVAVMINTHDIETSHRQSINTLMPMAQCVDYITEEQCQKERERSKRLVESGALDIIDSATSKHRKEGYSIFWLFPETLKETSNARMDAFIKLYDFSLEEESQKAEPDPKTVEELKYTQNTLKEIKVIANEAIDDLYITWAFLAFPPLVLVWLLALVVSKALSRLHPRPKLDDVAANGAVPS